MPRELQDFSNLYLVAKVYGVKFSSSLSPKDLQPFTNVIAHWGRENNQTLGGLSGHWL